MSGTPPWHRHFLVSCLGAYDDSGLGTGGFVAVHDGVATIIDKIDSTGLCRHGDVVYRFARGLRAIVGYKRDRFHFLLKVPEAADVHDIMLRNGQFVCASTGSNELLWVDPLAGVARRWRADGERDAWHLNGLCEVNGRLHFSAFGRFETHRGWIGGCLGRGFILDLESGNEVVSGLSGPHNPRYIDDQWTVCDSHAHAIVFEKPGYERQSLALGGFTRGLDHDEQFLYVGESANRKAPVPAEHSTIAVVHRARHEVVARIPIPFPEIYDLMIVTPDWTEAMIAAPANYQVHQADERFAALENQVALGWREIDVYKKRIAAVRHYELFRARCLNVKRWLIG